MQSPPNPSLFTLTAFARARRKAPTLSEAILWDALRDRRFRGIKFRREHVLSPYVVDFFAHSLKLALEVDGSSHDARSAEDAARDAEIARIYDVRVVRFAAGRVENDLTAVLRELAAVTG